MADDQVFCCYLTGALRPELQNKFNIPKPFCLSRVSNPYKGGRHAGYQLGAAYRFLYQSVSLWEGGELYLIFGSGTKLIVTDEQVVKPVVSVYPAAPTAQLEGKRSLLCVASAMFPPLVQISWRRRAEDGPLEELPPAEGEQLELRESGRTAAIRVIDQDVFYTYKYLCSVRHEGGTVEAQREQEVPALSLFQYKVKLLVLLYTVLIVKSLVYCCGLCLLRILTNKGPSINSTHAD
uniref:uncharacterized protein n=1 Tax=Semicossyphus pulcher TaxID=241346 RepID=UPI0037E8B569